MWVKDIEKFKQEDMWIEVQGNLNKKPLHEYEEKKLMYSVAGLNIKSIIVYSLDTWNENPLPVICEWLNSKAFFPLLNRAKYLSQQQIPFKAILYSITIRLYILYLKHFLLNLHSIDNMMFDNLN